MSALTSACGGDTDLGAGIGMDIGTRMGKTDVHTDPQAQIAHRVGAGMVGVCIQSSDTRDGKRADAILCPAPGSLMGALSI